MSHMPLLEIEISPVARIFSQNIFVGFCCQQKIVSGPKSVGVPPEPPLTFSAC